MKDGNDGTDGSINGPSGDTRDSTSKSIADASTIGVRLLRGNMLIKAQAISILYTIIYLCVYVYIYIYIYMYKQREHLYSIHYNIVLLNMPQLFQVVQHKYRAPQAHRMFVVFKPHVIHISVYFFIAQAPQIHGRHQTTLARLQWRRRKWHRPPDPTSGHLRLMA